MEYMSGRRGGSYEARVLWVEWLSRKVFAIRMERPVGFQFLPGQSIRVDHDGVERDYSLVSGPADPHLTLCVLLVPGGMLSPRLAGLQPGDLLRFSRPHGYFLFQSDALHPVFVATGTGVAPFVSMVRAGTRAFTLLHGVRNVGDLYYREVVSPAALRYIPCLSAETAEGCYRGRVTEWAMENLAPGPYDFYLCGNRSMIRDFTLLADERFSGSRVCTEVFH
jgi:benzoate/toluate 1,2-dioxygenase reductase component